MSTETLTITAETKAETYTELIPQIETIISTETNIIANLANITAILKETFGWFWVGFYLCINKEELVLGPFQGPLACTRIKYGRGVCGTSWKNGETIIVDDVELFDGHIACSSLSKSEIVVPIYLKDNIFGVLDIDSEEYSSFDNDDKEGLETISTLISQMLEKQL